MGGGFVAAIMGEGGGLPAVGEWFEEGYVVVRVGFGVWDFWGWRVVGLISHYIMIKITL